MESWKSTSVTSRLEQRPEWSEGLSPADTGGTGRRTSEELACSGSIKWAVVELARRARGEW